jgi:glucose/arabinose dehydrogenase
LKFNNLHPPPSVPQQKESAWRKPDFVPPLATFFTVPPGYDFEALGNATIAPPGIDVYTQPGTPGWANSVLVTGFRTGAIYRLKLAANRLSVARPPVVYCKSNDRYRDTAVSPDGRRIYVATDSFGTTMDGEDGGRMRRPVPGALLEFEYTGVPAKK